MTAPSIKLNYNDSEISIFWGCDTSAQYPSINLYWSLNADMSGEALVASRIPNNPDTYFSKEYAFFKFKRSSIGLQDTSTFYLRLKGVDTNGVEDIANPGEIKLVIPVSDNPGQYKSVMLQGYDSENGIWRDIGVSPDGSIGVTGGGGGGGAQGATGIAGPTGAFGGPQGATGIAGPTGAFGGPQGATGIAGATGLSGVGVTGLRGTTGVAGLQGATGLRGTTGVAGIGVTGLRGTTGVAGIGVTGLQGLTGVAGIGVTGLHGVTGVAGTAGLQGSTGVAGIGFTGLQGVTGISGSGSESADQLPLGVNYSNGIFAWESTTNTSNALDDTNKLLLAIAPSPPNSLSGNLVLSGTTKYNAILPTGLPSAWYQDSKVAGNSISDYVIDGSYNLGSPNNSTDFKVGSTFGGDEGAIQHVENGSVVASRDVSSGVGSTDSIEITAVVTHNSIWRRANARINYTQTTEGYKSHVMRYLSASVDQTTSATKIWFDNQDPTPVFSTGASLVQNTLSSSRYLSGVRYYSTGDTFDIACVVSNIANKAIRPTNPISYSMPGITAVNVSINGSSFAYNADYTMNVSGAAISASNVNSINAVVSITATKPSGKTASSSSSNQNRMVNTYSSTYSTNGDIYMVDERYRWTLSTDFSNIPTSPTNPTGNWDSSTPLTNGNAILYNSVWDYPAINFTSGYLPAQSGNNYSTFSGDQVAVWSAYIGLAHSSMRIVFTGIVYTAISAIGTGNLNIELRLPGESDWLDTGKAFGDGNGCRLGSSSGSTLNVSFGTLSSTNSSGVVFIRVTLRNTSAGKVSRMQISGT